MVPPQLHCLALMRMMLASQSWGILLQAVLCQEDLDISCEVIDLRTLLPWDAAAVGKSYKKKFSMLHLQVHMAFVGHAALCDAEMHPRPYTADSMPTAAFGLLPPRIVCFSVQYVYLLQ